MANIRQFVRGRPIPAAQLNRLVDGVNELQADAAPRQRRRGSQAPLITDDVQTEGITVVGVWQEIYRATSTVRVTNPEDENQYVDVDRVERIYFALPDGSVVMQQLAN